MTEPLVPGQIRTADGNHELHAGRKQQELVVTNDGDRPVQIGHTFTSLTSMRL